jgi:hypothetical protein
MTHPERDELEPVLQRVGVGVGLPLQHEGVERARVVLDRVAHLERGERHEGHLALELLEHARDVGRRELRLVATGDRVEHGQQEVEARARRERIGVAHHEVAGDHRVDEVLRCQLAVARSELVGGLVLHDDPGDVLHGDRTDLGHRLELGGHLGPQLVGGRERIRQLLPAGDELIAGAGSDAAEVDLCGGAVGPCDAGVVELLGDLGHPAVAGAGLPRLLRRRPDLDRPRVA